MTKLRKNRLDEAATIIRDLRLEAGISTAKMAELLGVERGTVYGWEGGRCLPSRDNTIRMARLFHTRPELVCALETIGKRVRIEAMGEREISSLGPEMRVLARAMNGILRAQERAH